ncbi:hypothetical protein BH10BAC1_BH10BAC1_03940 [soil metagenome]
MKKILLSTLIIFSASISFSQTRVLYYVDGIIGADQMDSALINAGCVVTTVPDDATFQTEIATPANYDMAIIFAQNNAPTLASVTALATFVTNGRLGIYADWSLDVPCGNQVGVNFTGNVNETVVTVTDPTLAAGLATNPFTISNTGWGTFSCGLLPLTGSTVAGTFASGEAAIVKSISNRMIVFGYLSDVSASSDLYETAISSLEAVTAEVPSIESPSFVSSIYPNPANNFVNVSITGSPSGIIEISIVDLQGKVVSKTVSDNLTLNYNTKINTENIAKGLYYLNIKSAKGLVVNKLTIQ